MTHQELYTRIRATKSFLQREVIRNKTNNDNETLTYRQIGVRMDMIHEAERVGIRNLGERQNRKLVKMINELEDMRKVSLN